MNKEQIKKELLLHENILNFADAELMKIVKDTAKENIAKLKEQLEAEKPKLRHGDCVIEHDIPRIVLNKKKNKGQFASFSEKAEDLNSYNYAEQHKSTVLFNIFDLIKYWGKDFKDFTVLGQYNFIGWISIKNPDRIHLKIVGGESTYTEVELYEIWRKLGHAIIELKRKKQGD